VPITTAMASISGTDANNNSIFIPEPHAVLLYARFIIEAISRFLTV